MVVLLHTTQLVQHYVDGVQYIEHMLRAQLRAAVGKELQAHDFDEYMEFHLRKFLRAEFRPRPFSHPVRRPGRHPAGTLSIEQAPEGLLTSSSSSSGAATRSPVRTYMRQLERRPVQPKRLGLHSAHSFNTLLVQNRITLSHHNVIGT